MIIIHAVLPIRPDARDQFLGAASELVEASNAEAGVLEYGLQESVAIPNTFTMIERYTDQAALDAHHGSEHFTTAIAALPGWVSGPPTFSRYNTEEDSDLPLG